MSMKVLGGKNLPSRWERFDRLQRTAGKLGGLAESPRGVFRFSTFAEFDEWKRRLPPTRRDHPSKTTS